MSGIKSEVQILKERLGGYKTSNENYRKKVESLNTELVHVRERLSEELKRNEDYDTKNHDAINQFYREKSLLNARIVQLEKEKEALWKDVQTLSNELEAFKKLPWYKKIFAK